MSKRKILERISGVIVVALCVILAYGDMAGANNYQDEAWTFTAPVSSYTWSTPNRNKTDTSKVYVKNLSSSVATINASIYGRKNSTSTPKDCTFNSGSNISRYYPYSIAPGAYKYMSSTVYEEFGSGAYAFIEMNVYTTGKYNGLWSPDNKNGY